MYRFNSQRNIKGTLCILLLGVLFIACKDDKFNQNELMRYNGKIPDESATNLDLNLSEAGKLSFEIHTPLLNKYGGDNPYMDCPEGIEIISYDNDGTPEARLTADYAINEERNMRMEARRNVVITNLKQGDTLKTKKIIWDKRNKRIYSNVRVIQIRADGTVNIGDGFDADERFAKYTVRNPRGQVVADEL